MSDAREGVSERSVKGGNCVNTLQCLRDWLGDSAYLELVGRLPEDVQVLCKRRILTIEWVPYRLWQHVSNAILYDACKGDEQQCIAFNKRLAESALNTTYKFVMRFLRSSDVLERVCQRFPSFNTHGEVKVASYARTGDAIAIVLHVRNHAPWHCYALALHGILLYVLEATGAKGVLIERSPSRIHGGGLDVDFNVRYRV